MVLHNCYQQKANIIEKNSLLLVVELYFESAEWKLTSKFKIITSDLEHNSRENF